MLLLRVALPALCALAVLLVLRPASASANPETTDRARKFLDAHTRKLRPLEVKANLLWWEANTTGADEAYKKKIAAQNEIDEALADRETFAEVKKLKDERDKIHDATLRRAIDVVYLQYLEKQVD